MKSKIDYQEVFESISDPIAVSDEEGWIIAMNPVAEALLEPEGDVRLILTARETVRQMRMTPNHRHEFFLADVLVEGARKRHVSVSLGALEGGGYRVAFDPEPVKGLTSNVRLLQSLVNAHRHMDLFVSADRVAALFAACFQEVFPDLSFHLEFDRPKFVFQHSGWGTPASRREGIAESDGKVAGDDLLWTESAAGYRISSGIGGTHAAILQVERRTDAKFSVSDREAFETFIQQSSLALGRLWHREDFSKVSPIIDQLDTVVLVCDARRKVRVTNRTFDALVGESAVGRDVLEFLDEASGARLRTSAAAVMAGGEAQPFEAHLLRSGDSMVTLEIQVAPSGVRDSVGAAQGFIVTAGANQTSLSELTARIQHAEHLLNIGQLATGVAHELKNPLTSILNYADYLLQKYEGKFFEDKDRERLQRIISGVEHIDSFVKDLLLLARPDADTTEMVDMKRLFRESCLACELVLERHKVQVIQDAPADVRVRGSRAQLKQVFVNLISNAARAMPEHGGEVRVSAHFDDDFVICRVSDNAQGMDPELLTRIFEPFFTTRDTDGGTGLGLAIVDTIVRRHSGVIEVESAQGEGTVFSIRFPVTQLQVST